MKIVAYVIIIWFSSTNQQFSVLSFALSTIVESKVTLAFMGTVWQHATATCGNATRRIMTKMRMNLGLVLLL